MWENKSPKTPEPVLKVLGVIGHRLTRSWTLVAQCPVMRYFLADKPETNFTGIDINQELIDWCSAHISGVDWRVVRISARIPRA